MEERNALDPQLLSGETRAASCQAATTRAHTVAFSVLDVQGQDGTQDVSAATLFKRLFLTHVLTMHRSLKGLQLIFDMNC